MYLFGNKVSLRFGATVASLVLLSSLQGQSAFSTGFEAPVYTPGTLVSDPDWNFDASGLTVDITDSDASGGSQSLRLTGDRLFDYSSNSSATLPSVQWLDFYLKPIFTDVSELPLSFDAGRTAATGFVTANSGGEVYAVDGDGQGSGQWLATGETLALTGDQAQDWLRLTYRLDYANKTWDLFVDGEMIAIDLGFLNTQATRFDQFALRGDGTKTSGFDDFAVNAANPLHTDTSNDGLPDSWLLANGLDINVNQRYQDGDSDGLNNLTEYLHSTLANNADSDGDSMLDGDEITYKLNPLAADVNGANGLVRRDVWTGIGGNEVWRFTNHPNFPLSPNKRLWANDDLDFSQAESLGNNYGQRIYGMIVAPETGDYTFWIAGDNHHEFWLSTDESPSNRERIAYHNWITGYLNFSASPTGQSAPVHLTAGQAYYFEILHKEFRTNDYVSVAWKYGSEPLHIITAEHLRVATPEAGDDDQDGLPSAWEIANGLDENAGYGVNGYAGDLDGDGILNYKERLLGTRADLRDSDGDGYSDDEELNRFHSDPTVADLSATPVVVNSVNGSAFSGSRGSWASDGGELYSIDSTGSVSYDLNLAEAGAYRIAVEITEQNAYKVGASTFELRGSLNGISYGIQTASAAHGATAVVTYYLPYLKSGNYSFKLDWINGFGNSFLRIKSIRLERIDGADLNGNGIADWVEKRATENGSDTELPLAIYNSPFCFEGTSFAPASVTISSHPVGDSATVRDESVKQALSNSYYADIELSADEDRVVSVNDQNGLRTSQHTLTWAAFDAVLHDFHHIRLNDSMLLTAIGSTLPQARPIRLRLTAPDGTVETRDLAAQARLQALFDQAGDWQVQAMLLPLADEDPLVYDSVIRVSSANLAPRPILTENRIRTWTPSISDAEVIVETDAGLPVYERNPGTVPRSFELGSRIAGGRLIARLPNGAILSTTEARVIRDYSKTQTYNQIVQTFPDGTVMVSAYILLNEVPEDLSLDIHVFKSGVTFDDGTVWRTVTADDFDAQGRYKFFMLRSPGVSGGNCHRYWLKQDAHTL